MYVGGLRIFSSTQPFLQLEFQAKILSQCHGAAPLTFLLHATHHWFYLGYINRTRRRGTWWCPSAPTHLERSPLRPQGKSSSKDWWVQAPWMNEERRIQYNTIHRPLVITLTCEFLLTLPIAVSNNGLFYDLCLFRVVPFTCSVKC
jgi:hypothetical protein